MSPTINPGQWLASSSPVIGAEGHGAEVGSSPAPPRRTARPRAIHDGPQGRGQRAGHPASSGDGERRVTTIPFLDRRWQSAFDITQPWFTEPWRVSPDVAPPWSTDRTCPDAAGAVSHGARRLPPVSWRAYRGRSRGPARAGQVARAGFQQPQWRDVDDCGRSPSAGRLAFAARRTKLREQRPKRPR